MTEQSTLTNETPHSTYDVTGLLMPARAFFFIIVDEPGKDGFLVRKIYASTANPYLSKMDLEPLRMLSETDPERYGLIPKNTDSAVSVAEHVMGNNKPLIFLQAQLFLKGLPGLMVKQYILMLKKH